MSSLMEYNGYHARIEFDDEDQIFVGHVIGINDSLNFHGTSVEELSTAFRDSINNYLIHCEECGKQPEKEFRGMFNVRISPDKHRQAALAAAKEGITMNQFIVQAIDAHLASVAG